MKIIKKAGCFFINLKDKKIALVLRRGDYSFPKGHLEKNETIKECAIRETIEETGHEVQIIGDEISVIKYESSAGENVENHLFLGIDIGITDRKIEEKDKEKIEWFDINEVEEKLSYQNLKDIWRLVKPKIEKIFNNVELDIIVSKEDKYYYSYIRLKGENYLPTNIYCIEDLNLNNIKKYNFENHIIYFQCNIPLNVKVIYKLKDVNCYIVNKEFYEHNYTKLEVQKILDNNKIYIPKISKIDSLNKISYPIFCKENSHVGINLIAYSENTLIKFFSKFDISDFYCEEVIKNGNEMKLYCIKNEIYDSNKSKQNKELKQLFNKISKILNLEVYSVDIINKDTKNIIVDINPNSGYFGSNIARKEFLKFINNSISYIIGL